jgi:hypothetical protein
MAQFLALRVAIWRLFVEQQSVQPSAHALRIGGLAHGQQTALTGTGRLTAVSFTRPTPPSESRDGSPGGGFRLFMALKRTIREHPSWDDARVARAARAHPVLDAGLVATARNDVAADAAIHGELEIPLGGPEVPF